MSLRSFLEEMEKKGDVLHVKEEVSPRFEASSIINAFDGGPFLFFDKVRSYKTKIAANVSGTREQFERAKIPTGKKIAEIIEEMRKT